MESVIQNLRTEQVPRLRLGIGDLDAGLDADELVEFVLSEFSSDEEKVVDEMVIRAAGACEAWLESGLESTMNRFNR